MTTVNLGSVDTGTPNQGDGSTIRQAFEIVNDNIDKLNLQLNGTRTQASNNQVTYLNVANDLSANTGAIYGLNIYGGIVFSRGSEVLTSSSGSWNGGNVSQWGIFSNTDASTSTTTGMLQAFGGVGIRGNINVGGTVNTIAGNLTVGNLTAQNTTVGALSATGATTVSSLSVANATNLIGNVIAANISASGTVTSSNLIVTAGIIGNITTSNLISTASTIGTATMTAATITTANITGTTTSTSTTTGALKVAGGAGIGGNLFVGGTISTGSIKSTNSTEFSISAPLIYLESAQTYPYDFEIGMYGHFIGGTANTYGHTGFVRNTLDNIWYLFSNVTEPAGGHIDLADSGIIYDAIKTGTHTVSGQINTTGNITSGESFVATSGVYANSYFYANGTPFVSSNYGNTNVTSLLTSGVAQIGHSGTTGVGDIGSLSNTFGNVYAVASSAKYADLAEKYQSDADYEPGTVLVFGTDTEVTISTRHEDNRVAGVVTTNPAYLMNSEAVGVAVALQGRVPCRVIGTIRRGDMMVTSDTAGVATSCMPPFGPHIGTVIGKALQNYDSNEVGVIEIVVGRV
jgi:hypothetical protein